MENAVEATKIGVRVRAASGGRTSIIEGATLHIPQGSTAAIVGRSGSGKSTLLSVLGLMKRPTSGTLRIAGRDVTEMGLSEMARMRSRSLGFVFQDYSLIPHLTVMENVTLPFLYGEHVRARVARRTAGELLEVVGLAGFNRRRPGQLSGGEQQRVAIARALVRSPALVLADEPTGALDSATGDRILALLRTAAGIRNTTLLVVTHDLDVAASMDRRWTLADGELVPIPCLGTRES